MKLRELKKALDDLTSEQLEQQAAAIGVEVSGGEIVQVSVLDEDWVYDGEAPCPRSIFDENREPGEEDDPPLVWPRGMVQIVFEPEKHKK
jgi:hypothetical protein